MAITLSYNGTTANLGDRLIWTDEFRYSAVEKVIETGTKGALMVHQGVRVAGRPITLDGVESKAWITRALCASLQAWSDLPNIFLTLTLRGVSRSVIFDNDGFEAVSVWRIADGHETPEQVFLPTFRFLTADPIP